MAESTDDLRAQLADLNRQITELGGDRDAMYAEVGGEADGAQNPEDVASELTNAQEVEGVLDALYAKRERLHAALGD